MCLFKSFEIKFLPICAIFFDNVEYCSTEISSQLEAGKRPKILHYNAVCRNQPKNESTMMHKTRLTLLLHDTV